MNADWNRWYGDHHVRLDAGAKFILGPLEVHAYRSAQEWDICWRREGDPLSQELQIKDLEGARASAEEDFETERFARSQTAEVLRLAARLADRPVVSRPEDSLRILPQEKVIIWISSPLWVTLAERSDGEPMLELPIARMSDTWFGPNTRHGTLCYATRTKARISAPSEPLPFRAVTQVEVTNASEDALPISRINLPMRNLTLYHSVRGFLSSAVRVRKDRDGKELEVTVDASHPPESERLAEPREEAERGLVRGFQALLS